MHSAPGDITRLLAEMRDGSDRAEAELLDVVYRELRRIAAAYLRREQGDHTLQPTALVNEAYLRLTGQADIQWQNRGHFFAVAARVMRRILVDYSRARNAGRRGGGAIRIDFPESLMVSDERTEQVLALDEALNRLAEFDPRQSKIVEMRFFAGLTEEEISEVLGVSIRTVKRDWRMARAWLYGEMTKELPERPSPPGEA